MISTREEVATLTAMGPKAAPAIVFVHGTRLTRAVWVRQLDALAGEFRVIAVDLPGHGTRAEEPFTLDRAADIVADAIRTGAAGGAAIVVGLSLGGYVAMALAARDPALVRGLVVAGATAEPIGIRSVPFLALAMLMERFNGRAMVRLNTWYFRAAYPGPVAEAIVAGGFWWKGGAQGLRTLVGQRFAQRLAAYPGPTLILNGQRDLLFRLSASTFAAAARDPRRVLVARAPHLSNLGRPAAFNHAVRRFAHSIEDG